MKACDDLLAAVLDRAGLVAVKIDFTNLYFELRRCHLSVVFGASVCIKQPLRDLIDEIISSLCGKNERHQQFERVGEVQVELGVGMDPFQSVKDLFDRVPVSGGGISFLRVFGPFSLSPDYDTNMWSISKGGKQLWN